MRERVDCAENQDFWNTENVENPNNEANAQNTQHHSMYKPKEKWLLWCARLQSLAANCKCFSGGAYEVHIVKIDKKIK